MSEVKDEFYENQEKPWWWYRCVHREHSYWVRPNGEEVGCWQTLKEAEQVAVLHLVCLSQVHICVEIAQVGSVCKALTWQQYKQMSDPQIMQQVQGQFRELKSLQ